MATKNTIRRNYLIIRRLLQNDLPSRETLLQYLKNYDCEISLRTFQRDIADIRSNFDIEIIYDTERNGYYIDQESIVDLSKLLYFISLADSSDIILDSIRNKQDTLKYVSVSPNTEAKGVEHIGILLQAIRNTIEIQFEHYNYSTKETKRITAEPYLLKEFGGRWYAFAYLRKKEYFRTFGLDRISNIVLSDKQFRREQKLEDTAHKFDNVYGLIYEPEQNKNAPIEEVRLKFAELTLNHISALPLHHSQKIDNGIVVLKLIVNPEIENKILSYGEKVEVLSPQHLGEKIKLRLTATLKRYEQ